MLNAVDPTGLGPIELGRLKQVRIWRSSYWNIVASTGVDPHPDPEWNGTIVILPVWDKTRGETDRWALQAFDHYGAKTRIFKVHDVRDLTPLFDSLPDQSVTRLVFAGHSSDGCGFRNANPNEAPQLAINARTLSLRLDIGELIARKLARGSLVDFQSCGSASYPDEVQLLANLFRSDVRAAVYPGPSFADEDLGGTLTRSPNGGNVADTVAMLFQDAIPRELPPLPKDKPASGQDRSGKGL